MRATQEATRSKKRSEARRPRDKDCTLDTCVRVGVCVECVENNEMYLMKEVRK